MLCLVCNDIFFIHHEIKWAQTTGLKAQTNGVNFVFKKSGELEVHKANRMYSYGIEFFNFSCVSIRKVDF